MSYDLYFLRSEAQPPLEISAFLEYFSSRPRYNVSETQAWYENEDTGVYFSFDFGPPEADLEFGDDEGEAPQDGYADAGASFNINYFRPHIFGREAAPELAAFVSNFNLFVDDPQNSGMGRGEFSERGFLEGWNAGNRFGYEACLNPITTKDAGAPKPPSQHLVLPADELDRLWCWNHRRSSYQDSIQVDAYVSVVRLFAVEGQVKSFVVWGDGIPEAFPMVDYVVLVRDELAVRKLFRKKERDMCLVAFDAVKPLLELAKSVDEPLPHYLFDYTKPPKEIVAFFRDQDRFEGSVDGVAPLCQHE